MYVRYAQFDCVENKYGLVLLELAGEPHYGSMFLLRSFSWYTNARSIAWKFF